LLDTYSRNVYQKPVNVETVLLCQDDKEIDLSAMRRTVLVEAKKASNLLPLVASIHNQLPTKCTKETFRSTRVTEEHDLNNTSDQELKKLRRLRERADRREHSGSDDDMEDRPDRKKKRHHRDSMEQLNVLREENTSMKLAHLHKDEMSKMAAEHHQSVIAVLTNAQRPATGHTPFAVGAQYKSIETYTTPAPLPPPPLPPTQDLRYPNANTPDGVKPWIKDRTFKGCRRCHSTYHDRAGQCPGRVPGVPYCHYCCSDYHDIPTCPELARKTCSRCKQRGHDAKHCQDHTGRRSKNG
jgi:hypothetical protein